MLLTNSDTRSKIRSQHVFISAHGEDHIPNMTSCARLLAKYGLQGWLEKIEIKFSTEVMIQEQGASGGQSYCFLHSDIICVEFTVLCKQSCMHMTITFMHTEVLFLIVQLHSFKKATPALATSKLRTTEHSTLSSTLVSYNSWNMETINR